MFDAHTHLQDSRLERNLDRITDLAGRAGITGISCCGTRPEDWAATAALTLSPIPFLVHPAFGIHPWYVTDSQIKDGALESLEAWLRHFPIAAVGEIGLDGIRESPAPSLQKKMLTEQLQIAAGYQRPVILHGARVWEVLLQTIRPFAAKIPGILVHSFGGSKEQMRQFLDLGAFLSFSGSVCNPRAVRARAAATEVPLSHLLVETDTPDIFPENGARANPANEESPLNQPANLHLVIQSVAALRNVPATELAAETEANARRLFFPTLKVV